MRQEKQIGIKRCFLYGEQNSPHVLIQAIDAHDLEGLGAEYSAILSLTDTAAPLLVAFLIDHWNTELSPWCAPAVFGKDSFGAGAADTLSYVMNVLIPDMETVSAEKRRYYLGGYSLSGLFSLWAAYQTDRFAGICAASPSVWFPGWMDYVSSHAIQSPLVYLSLGEREERTRNQVMSKVGDNIRQQNELLSREPSVRDHTLEWNKGNHFKDSEIRTARGFAWLLNHR